MCGIFGIVGPEADRTTDRQVENTLDLLSHRGPDERGIWRDNGIILGHTRLSILDLSSTGAQPMISASGDTVIAYNGEIYGYGNLARDLASSGKSLRGTSDTEIVLESLELYGNEKLHAFNGMFGLAHWRRREQELLLARDDIGIKPLYYAALADSLIFCSELTPILRLDPVARDLDTEALGLYMTLGMVPAPWTIARSVRQLMPGERLVRNRDGSLLRTRSKLTGRVSTLPKDTSELDQQLKRLIIGATADQLIADVPVGVLLSGGVDSSVVAAAAARSTDQLRTFSVIHDNPMYDEREFARGVASHIGSKHTEIEMPTGGLTTDELDGLVKHHGDPFADSSSLPTRRLAKEVRRHVTVALSGDGGDELFCGYPRYWQGNLVNGISKLPTAARWAGLQGLRLATKLAPASRRGLPRRAARAFSLASRPEYERAIGTICYFWPDEQRKLFQPAYRSPFGSLGSLIADRSRAGIPSDTAEGCHFMEQQLVLPDDMLVKVDRMSMAESLEVRPVLLDNRIVDFSRQLPMKHKLSGKEGKLVLKRIARDWVPPWVVDRPKKGFAVPLLDFGGQVLADATRWSLESHESPGRSLLTNEAAKALAAEFQRRGDGQDPEDSAFRRSQRQWTITVLSLALSELRINT